MKFEKRSLVLLLTLAIIMTSVFIPVQRVSAAETEEGSLSDFDYIFEDEEYLLKVCQAILDLPLTTSNYYVGYNSLVKSAQKVKEHGMSVLTDTEKRQIKTFLLYCYRVQCKADTIYSAFFRKLGFFCRSIKQWFGLLKNNAEEIVNQFSLFVENNIVTKEVDNSTVVKGSPKWMNSIKRVSDQLIEYEHNKYYVLVPTLSWSEAGELSEEIADDFDKWLYLYDEGLQYALDNFGDSDSYFYVLAYTPLDHSNQYQHYMTVTDMGDSPYIGGVYSDSIHVSIESTEKNTMVSTRSYSGGTNYQYFRQQSAGILEYFLPSSWTSEIQFPYFNNPLFNRYSVSFIIQKDKKPLKLFKSKALADQYNSSSNGYPYGYYASNSYNTQNGNSYTVGGDFVNSSNTENDYTTINNTVINNYTGDTNTGDTINNIINDYHTEINGGAGTGDNNGDDNGGNGGGSGGGSGEGTHVNSFLEDINTMGEFFTVWFDRISSFKNFPSSVKKFLTDTMQWIPTEDIALISFGISSVILIGIWKIIRG